MLERSLSAAGEPDFLGFHMLAPQPAWSRAGNFELWSWQCCGVCPLQLCSVWAQQPVGSPSGTWGLKLSCGQMVVRVMSYLG